MADEELTVELESSPSAGAEEQQGPLVAVTFQKNPGRKQKYLEAEPQALGITQIGLSVFQISWTGSLAIAAQNLHIPTLRACLGMQVVACAASLFNMTFDVVTLGDHRIGYECWSSSHYQNTNITEPFLDWCYNLENAYTHMYAGCILIQAALVAISATLAAYCCKVIDCCSPAPRMPVITVQAPPAQQ